MKTYLKEKIGNPGLFTGRKSEITYFLNWIGGIKREISMSTAVLSRRKTGKTALMQHLYNLVTEKETGVIPLYYELREGKQWVVNFCQDFYLTYIYQYIAFKTRKPEYARLSQSARKSFSKALSGAREVGEYLLDDIRTVESLMREGRADLLWNAVREMPRTLATDDRGESVLHQFPVPIKISGQRSDNRGGSEENTRIRDPAQGGNHPEHMAGIYQLRVSESQ